MGPKPEHRETVNAVEDWLRQYGFIVLKGYSVPIMDTHTAVVAAFSEAYRRERGQKYKRIVPVVKPDLLAQSYKLRTTIAVEVAITSNPVKEAEKLGLLNMEHEVARPLIVTSSHMDGWIGDIPFVSCTHLDDLLMKALVTGKMRNLEIAFKKRC